MIPSSYIFITLKRTHFFIALMKLKIYRINSIVLSSHGIRLDSPLTSLNTNQFGVFFSSSFSFLEVIFSLNMFCMRGWGNVTINVVALGFFSFV